MLDIAILIIPKIEPQAPTVGPAILKSHVEAEGFTCKVIDLNISFKDNFDWQYKDNTPKVRARRMKEIWDLINSIIGRDPFMEKIVASHMQEFNND